MTTTVDILVDFGLTGLGPVAGGGSGALRYTVYDADGGVLVARTNAGVVEQPAGSGIYHARVTTWDTTWVGRVVWDDGAGHYAAEAFYKVGDQAAGGGSGLTPQQVRDAMKLGPSAGAPAAGSIDALVSGAGGVAGAGADSCTLTVTDEDGPVADADVWVSSDADGALVVAGTKQTNSQGKVTFLLDAGVTYYLWCQKDGENPIRGQAFTALAD